MPRFLAELFDLGPVLAIFDELFGQTVQQRLAQEPFGPRVDYLCVRASERIDSLLAFVLID